jgi:ankyrin repeat protein
MASSNVDQVSSSSEQTDEQMALARLPEGPVVTSTPMKDSTQKENQVSPTMTQILSFTNCTINDTSLNVSAASSTQDQNDSPQIGKPSPPHDLSKRFGKTCLKIAKKLDNDGMFEDLKLVFSCWEFAQSHFCPHPQNATSVKDFFTRAAQCKIWSWADFANLTDLLASLDNSELYLQHLREYEAEFKKFHDTPLDRFSLPKGNPMPTSTETACIDAKWKGDSSKLLLSDVTNLKEAIADHVEIPNEEVVFDCTFTGSITIRWVILNEAHYSTVSEKCKSDLTFKGESVSLTFHHPLQPLVFTRYMSSRMYVGNEYQYSVPEYITCGICLDVVQEPVMCQDCFATFCSKCSMKHLEERNHCPLCQKDFKPRRNEYIDKRILPNVFVRCSKCNFWGNLFNMPEHTCSEAEHLPIVLPPQSSEMGTPPGELDDTDLKCLKDDDSPLDRLQHLIDKIEDLDTTFKTEASMGTTECFTNVQAKIDAVKAFVQQYEVFFSTADASIASYQENKLSIMEKYPTKDDASITIEGEPSGIKSESRDGLPPMQSKQDGSGFGSKVATDLMRPLHLASWYGWADKVGPLVQDGEDINAVGMFGLTPLHIAALRGHGAVVFELLSHGANVQATCGRNSATPAVLAQEAHNYFISHQLTARRALIQELNRLINLAAEHGDTDLLVKLIKWSGKSCDVMDVFSGYTPLQVACLNGYHDMAEKLLELGATVDKKNRNHSTALHLASKGGSLQCAQLLIQNGADVQACDLSGASPMHLACSSGHLDIVRELLSYGGSPNLRDATGATPIHDAASQGNVQMVELLFKQSGVEIEVTTNDGFTPLLVAASRGHVKVATTLLERGADPNAKNVLGQTPLHVAAFIGNVPMIELLHKHGADISAINRQNFTALHYAVRSGILQAVIVLVELDCPLDVITGEFESVSSEYGTYKFGPQKSTLESTERSRSALDGSTPAHLASCFGFLDIVEYLYRQKANFAICTNAGYSPLHLAVQEGHLNVVHFLLSHQCCNPNEKTKKGLSSLHLATLCNDQQMVMLLVKNGCDKELKTSLDKEPKGLTAFLLASIVVHPKIVATLCQQNCRIDAQTDDGLNALHLAIIGPERVRHSHAAHTTPWSSHGTSIRKVQTVRCLIDLGVDPNKASCDGLTPLDLALHQNDQNVIKLLRSINAKQTGNLKDIMQKMEEVGGAVKEMQHELKRQQQQKKKQEEQVRSEVKQLVLSSTPHLQDIVQLVVTRICFDWHNLGMLLDIDDKELNAIEKASQAELEKEAPSEFECCQKMFRSWLQGKGKRPITWQTLCNALRQAGRESVADNVLLVLEQHAMKAQYMPAPIFPPQFGFAPPFFPM